MKIFLFTGSIKGYAVLKKMLADKANLCGILCLVEDAHEEQYHPKVAALAKEHHIPIYFSNETKPADYADVLRKTNPDIAFAIGWRYIIFKEAYTIPPKGTLIVHDSLLPKYRGFAPTNWAMINGEPRTGVTLFHIAEGVDCGPIVDQLPLEIGIDDTISTVTENLIKLYETIISKNLPALAAGTAKAVPQNDAEATYTCKRTPEDGEINWQLSAFQIHNLIRATSHPFNGAFTTLQGKRVFIWGSELPEKEDIYSGCVPGRVLGKRNGKIEVLTGKGVLRVTRLQFSDDVEKNAADVTVSVKDTFGR